MPGVVRFTVSVEEELLGEFDQYCKQEEFATRSEAVRQLIRDRLTSRAWQSGSHEVAGTLTLVYDHHRSQLGERLTQLQHDNTDLIVFDHARASDAPPLPGGHHPARYGNTAAADRGPVKGPERDSQGRIGRGQCALNSA